MRIKSVVSSGEIFMHEDGSVELAPFQVFRMEDGGVCIRIGRTCYFFFKDGTYDGPECKPPKNCDHQAIADTLQESLKNRGRRPAEPYFEQGSPGFLSEIKSWPDEREEPPDEDTPPLHVYSAASPDKEEPN